MYGINIARPKEAFSMTQALPFRRHGYALKGVMMTLGLIVVSIVIAWPVIQGVNDIKYLRSAAEIVVEAATKARLNAMGYGQINLLRFQPETGDFAIQQQPDIAMDADLALGPQADSALRLPSIDWEIDGQKLPAGVYFVAVQVAPDERNAVLDDLMVDPAVKVTADSPLMFFPDGRSSTAELILRNDRGQYIEIKFNGHTGQASAGEPFTTQAIGPPR